MKLLEHRLIKGNIECLTGLHIGGAREQMEIGAVDLPVIKHPISLEPYIPGSSLKGKMRSELEKKEGRFGLDRRGEPTLPCGCGKCMVCRVFGPHSSEKPLGPTRILLRDAFMSEETRKEYERIVKEEGRSFIEEKTENIINRLSGTAEHPRTLERVPSGTKFDMEIVLQVFDNDDAEAMLDFVKEGLRLIEASYLGGSGSRGSGKVKFQDLTLDGEGFAL